MLLAIPSVACVGSRPYPKPAAEPSVKRGPSDPGRVSLRRLNSAEYNNTVRDLLGTRMRPADEFPPDGHAYGFDTIADALTLSPGWFEHYGRAAHRLIAEALGDARTKLHRVEAEHLEGEVGRAQDDHYNVWSNGELVVPFEVPVSGRYRLAARLWGAQAGDEPVKVSLRLDEERLGEFEVPETEATPRTLEQEVFVNAGKRSVAVGFLNDFYVKEQNLDRNLLIDWIELEGPLDAKPERAPALAICAPKQFADECFERIVREFASRAWRRPVTDDEAGRLMELSRLAELRGESVLAGLALPLEAVLISPHFVFRLELDADPSSSKVRPLTDYELASRLSYFLWSSMPDPALFELARAGRLQQRGVLVSQVRRMLADQRSRALVDNFFGQWLFLRSLESHEVDPRALGRSMLEESERFLREWLEQPRPLSELLTANFTYVDQRLAKHYGLSAEELGSGSQWVRVSLPDAQRGGLLRQASILTVTSMPNRTSPVKRGKWVLEQLLCSEPAPPPPGVPNLDEAKLDHTSLRELMEAHRANPECASCHVLMDPIGLALENYDALGRWRSEDAGKKVDASTVLPDGTKLEGAGDLSEQLARDPQFVRCMVEKLFIYGLGRGATPADEAPLEAIAGQLFAKRGSLSDAIVAIVQSPAFRLRRGGEAQGHTASNVTL
jgi:hypothetical protein